MPNYVNKVNYYRRPGGYLLDAALHLIPGTKAGTVVAGPTVRSNVT
jgi:hypothetical protein